MIFYNEKKAFARLPNGNTDYFDIVPERLRNQHYFA